MLARYFINEAGADDATVKQRDAARTLVESGQGLFMPKTVFCPKPWLWNWSGCYGGITDSTGIRLGLSLTHC